MKKTLEWPWKKKCAFFPGICNLSFALRHHGRMSFSVEAFKNNVNTLKEENTCRGIDRCFEMRPSGRSRMRIGTAGWWLLQRMLSARYEGSNDGMWWPWPALRWNNATVLQRDGVFEENIFVIPWNLLQTCSATRVLYGMSIYVIREHLVKVKWRLRE